jgi:hypothetical protein
MFSIIHLLATFIADLFKSPGRPGAAEDPGRGSCPEAHRLRRLTFVRSCNYTTRAVGIAGGSTLLYTLERSTRARGRMLSRVAETGHEIAASLPKEQCVLKLASRDRRTGANTPLCLPKIISRRVVVAVEPEAHRGIVMFAMCGNASRLTARITSNRGGRRHFPAWWARAQDFSGSRGWACRSWPARAWPPPSV